MKEFDIEALSEYDGKDGRPAYVVHEGRVFDVTGSTLWRGGSHMRRHHAGVDLTTDFGAAPHGVEVLDRVPQVGVIARKAVEKRMSDFLERLLTRFPMLRRHPHPMTVHFPIALMFSSTAFAILYLLTGHRGFETTSFHCLGAGLFFIPVVLLTGLFSWWLNYMAKPMPAVNAKIGLSIVLFLVALPAFTWRAAVPGLHEAFHPGRGVYFLLILSLTPLVSAIGWYGAKLTFPVEKE